MKTAPGTPNRLIVVEDDVRFAHTLRDEFRERGYEVFVADSLGSLTELDLPSATHAIVDLRLGKNSGLEAVTFLRSKYPELRLVVLTGYGSIPTAVEAIKRGADNYLTKPASADSLEKALRDEAADPEGAETSPAAETLHLHERDFVEAVLLQCGGNISAAARRLGIHRQSLQRKLRKFSG